MILVFENQYMKIFTQGHKRTTAASSCAAPTQPVVRRSVLLGSLVTLVAGSSLAFALPSFAAPSTTSGTIFSGHSTAATTRVSLVVPSTVSKSAVTTTTLTAATSTSTSTTVARHATNESVGSTITASQNSVTKVPSPTPPSPKTAPVVTSTPAPSVQLKLSTNIPMSPNFLSAGTGSYVNGVATYQNPCVTPQSTWPTFTNDTSCTNYILQAINNARAVEGVSAMVLPTNWFSLTTSQQLFVIANLERTARGLPAYVGLNAALSAEAQRAAQTNSDPGIASGFAIGLDAQGYPGMGGAWGGGFNVLATDYVWMYADGWSGSQAGTSNVACTSPNAAGCWAHREELLGSAPDFNPGVGLMATNAVMGTGFAVVNGHASLVDLIELPKGAVPALTFTWASEVPYLG